MDRAIPLPPGKWTMQAYGSCIYLVSPDHPPILIDGGEVKRLDPVESAKVLFKYDSQMNICSGALDEIAKMDGELMEKGGGE